MGCRLYRIWLNMRARASGKRTKTPRGPERGICDEWARSFDLFADWALANGYRDDLTIDRIDNDRGYWPDNCQWITRAENIRKDSTGENNWKAQHSDEIVRKAIRLVREFGFYQTDAAKLLGVNRRTLAAWISGQNRNYIVIDD